jgi:hypothetical protein
MNTNEASLGAYETPKPISQGKPGFHSVFVSMECTARWLENGRDPIEAAAELRLAMQTLKKCIADCEVAAGAQATGQAIAWTDVVKAIRAVADEAARRGEMYPQTRDEQEEDRKAFRRVCESIEWYATKGGSVAEKLDAWPTIAAPSPAAREAGDGVTLPAENPTGLGYDTSEEILQAVETGSPMPAAMQKLANEAACAYGHHEEETRMDGHRGETGHWWTFDFDGLYEFARALLREAVSK